MADNFDLRQFLTENKLTKNAQLLNEARVEGFDVNKKAFEVSFINKYGGGDFRILNAETPEQAEEVFTNIFVKNPDYVQSIKSIEPYQVPAPKPQAQPQPGLEGVDYGSIEIDGVDSNDYPDFVDAYVAYAEFEDGTPLSEEELYQLTDELYQSGELADRAAESLYEGKEKELKEGKSYKVSKNSKEAQHLKKGDIIGSGDEVVSVSAGAKTPSGKVEVTLKTKDGKTKTSTWGKTTKVGVKEKETVKENKMTQRDKYLTRLVENALGLEGYGDDNVNRQRAKQGLPPAQGPKYSEGITEDEMVEEKPLPKYENIEKLMQEIDKNTDEEAHKFKMQEMKRVADMLEKKCTALEEGDDADHIDQKKLKQMKKDIMTLRKGIEKMEKLGEKKFTKKETKAELKETKMENFDLKKFLIENKLTRNSRMLSEKLSYDDFEQMIKPFLDLAKSKGWVWNSSGDSWYNMISPAIALFHKDIIPTTKDGEYKGQPTELGKDPVANRYVNVNGPLDTNSADVIMSPDYDMEQAYFSAKDKTILDSIKGAMARNTDVIQDIKQTSSEFTTGGDFEPQNYYFMLLRKKEA